MTAIEKTVLDQFKTLLLQRLKLHRVILFGSRARGEAEPDSDMDVVVIVDGEITGAHREYISECAWQAGFEKGILLVPVAFSREEWENSPERSSLLAQAIEREGIAV